MRTQTLPQIHEQRNKSRGENKIDKNLLTPKLEKKIVDSIAILCQNLHVLCTWSWHKWINPVRSKQQYDESVYPLYIALHAITVSLLPGSSDMTLDFTSRRPDTTYDIDDFSSIYHSLTRRWRRQRVRNSTNSTLHQIVVPEISYPRIFIRTSHPDF